MHPGDTEICYAALRAKDTRFDGKFFVGVASTGIYCRPVCSAHTPKRENCTFYASAATAEAAGYRPCLRCRPELAPGSSDVDAIPALARRAAGLLAEHCGEHRTIEVVARQLCVSDRHLRRAFAAEYQVSPVQYLQTCRLLLAKQLLTDTSLTVTEVATASGFGSQRRLNDLFQRRYRLTPTQLRRQATESSSPSADLRLGLSYRPPYQWDAILEFLRSRAIPGVEQVSSETYARTVALRGPAQRLHTGIVRVRHRAAQRALEVSASATLLPVLPKVLARVRQLFDLACTPTVIAEQLAGLAELHPGLPVVGLRLPGSFDPFEMSVRAVLGQQITVQAATTLAGRLVTAFGTPIAATEPGLEVAFPNAEAFLALPGELADHLGPLGVTRARSATIRALAAAVTSRTIDLSSGSDPEATIGQLLALPGIGDWTAQYLAMRTLGYPDAFLPTDAGIKRALPGYTKTELLQLAEPWRPWRSYATINLWHSLSTAHRLPIH